MSVRLEIPAHLEDVEAQVLRTDMRRGGTWVWVALGAILVAYVFGALLAKPTASFGVFQDDGMYFSSAKALAMGEGYVLPGFPVFLRATKYPVLFPLLLSGIWRLDPHFPGNVKLAVGLTLAFGCGFLVIAFLLLREWPGMGDLPALVVAGLCVLCSQFLYLSACVMSDVPFCAVALGAVWLAMRGLRRSSGGELAAVGAGLLAGLSVGFKSLGIAVAAGIFLYFLLHRRYRLLAWLCLPAFPLAAVWLWPAFSALLHSTGVSSGAGLSRSGWTQTVCFYSSYSCSWRMGVTSFSTLKAVMATNLIRTFLRPGLYLLEPLATRGNAWGLILVALVSAAAYAGMARRVRSSGWEPLPIIFIFSLLIIVPWPWTPERFLLLFLPFFFGGLWMEGRRLASAALKYLKSHRGLADRIAASALAAGILVVAGAILANYAYSVPLSQHELGSEHAIVLADEEGAFEWIRQHTSHNATIIAYEDGLTYLSTGRPSIQPLATLPQSFFLHDPRFAREDAGHLADVAEHVDASYWLTSPYDSNFEDPGKFGLVQARQRQLLAGVTIAYRSPDGYVVLYDTRCMWNDAGQSCGQTSAAPR